MIGVYIESASMTVEQYKTIDERLRSAVGGAIEGLMLHSCFHSGDGLAIFDVWESEQAFEALGSKLMPIVQELGVEMSPPQFVEMVAYEVA
ncbi:MAG: hypothetical protein ACLP62_09420 [Acidimicrobiales bacterium]